MRVSDISISRLNNQQINSTNFKSPKEIVGWMGAMQAQEFLMAQWAIGIRLPDSTQQIIETAIDKGEILRTHLLRPTWHFVSSEDIYWLIKLTAPRIRASLKTRHRELGLTDDVYEKCTGIIRAALADGSHRTREELVSKFVRAGILNENNRASHILFMAELDCIICSGTCKAGKPTYALFGERVTERTDLTREEALKKLADKYFSSHGPATLQDFEWWSGLSLKDARNALEMTKSKFSSENTGSGIYWFAGDTAIKGDNCHLLPAYDEFLISYKDRTAAVSSENHKKTVSQNGLFRPVIVVNGQVAGIWKRTIKKELVIIETSLFKAYRPSIRNLIEQKAETYGLFLGRKAIVKHSIL